MRGDNNSSATGSADVGAALAVAAAAAAATGMDDRKRSLRFTLATDIVLLQEVNRRKPWASPHGKIRETWEQIAAAVTAVINDERDPTEPPARVDHGSSKRRYDVLMEAFAKDELKSMRAKGSVELYVRREELLTDLSLQLSQYHEQKIKVKKQSSVNGDVAAPVAAYAGIKRAEPGAVTPIGHQEVAIKRQALGSTTATAPRSSGAADFDSTDGHDGLLSQLRARELELAEKRLELDRARFESEREERQAFVAAMQANTTLLLRIVERLEGPNAQAGSTSSSSNQQLGAAANAFNTRQI